MFLRKFAGCYLWEMLKADMGSSEARPIAFFGGFLETLSFAKKGAVVPVGNVKG